MQLAQIKFASDSLISISNDGLHAAHTHGIIYSWDSNKNLQKAVPNSIQPFI